MAKSAYIGDTTGIAKKIKKMYVGDANGVARKVKKAYVGDANGIARLFYSGEKAVRWICVGSVTGTSTPSFWTSTGEDFELITPSSTLGIGNPHINIMFFKGKYFAVANDGNANNSNRIYSSLDLKTWTLAKTLTAQYSTTAKNGSVGCLSVSEDGSKLLYNNADSMHGGRAWTSDGNTWSQSNSINSTVGAAIQMVANNNYVVASSKPARTTSSGSATISKTTMQQFMTSTTSAISTAIYNPSLSSWSISYMITHNGCLYFLEYRFPDTSSGLSSVILNEHNLSTGANRQTTVNVSAVQSDPRKCSLYIEGDYLYAVSDIVIKFNINTLAHVATGGSMNSSITCRRGVIIKDDKIWTIGKQNKTQATTYYIDKTSLVATMVTNNLPTAVYETYACAFPIE